MSIRLYPCTDNTANLAMLIDVPQETFDRLDYIKEQCQEEYTDWRDEYYERISDDEELQKADDFRVLVGVSLTTQLIQNMVIHLTLTSL